MAETKVTDMVSATTSQGADFLYLIQNDTDKKISLTTLLGNLPAVITKLAGRLVVGGTPETLSNTGLIAADQTLTILTDDGTAGSLTIADGSYDGQIKIVLFTSGSASHALSSNIGVSSITFSAPGHSALLFWYSGSWWPIGGTATITV